MQIPNVLEVKGIRVLTTKQIAELYGADLNTVRHNFRYNKDKYILGKHYIEVYGEELRRLKTSGEFIPSLKYAKSAYLWTEKGALLHAKSLNTDKAWQVYDYLVDFYFRAKEKEPELPPKKEIVPTQTKTEPLKKKITIPCMEEPVFVFKNLLALAEEQGISLKVKDTSGCTSILKGNRIAVRKHQLFEKVERVQTLTGEKDEDLIEILLDDAEAFVLSYTNRTRLKTGLEKAVRDLAVIALNRMGTEGEKSRSEGGESYTFDDAPKQIYDTLNRYRLARVGGKTYEAEKKQA